MAQDEQGQNLDDSSTVGGERRRRSASRRRRSSRVERDDTRGSDRRSTQGQDRAIGLVGEVLDLQQGLLYAGIEAASAALDTGTTVTRNSIDRAFSRDFRDPGDLVRNVGRDAEETVRDVLEGVRGTPRRMHDGFYDAVREPADRRDRGERWRRAQQDAHED